MKNKQIIHSIRSFTVLGLYLLLQACSAAPRHTLTEDEKIADMYWLFSQFEENYAPLQYKEQKFGFDYQTLKANYIQEAKATKSNEEFYLVMHKFVAEFRDAHTASTLFASSLPNRTKVAFLGFDGIRSGNRLLVKSLLPTISPWSAYPIKVGDEITKVNGVPLVDLVKKDLEPYRNLGQDESNLSYLMPRFFNRISLNQPMPTEDSVVLTVSRFGEEVEVKMPWIVRDLYTFAKEQQEAAEQKRQFKNTSKIGRMDEAQYFEIGMQLLTGKKRLMPSVLKRINRGTPGFRFENSFEFVDTMPTWTSDVLSKVLGEAINAAEVPLDKLKRERFMPGTYVVVDPNATYPTYISAEKVIDKDGNVTGEIKQVAYMYLDTFSPGADEETVLREVKTTLRTLNTFGVKDLIIDMINNGGGSLTLGMKLAQLLSPTAITAPGLQFKLSETWMDEFQERSISAASDTERELGLRVFEGLEKDMAAGDLISHKWDFESLDPYGLNPNRDLKSSLNVYLLVNELCASMCDIFTATLKDNKLATVIGSKTMGAGGNVVMHWQAPNSHLIVNQTESLIVRPDGSYVENNGIEPDIAMDVASTAKARYSAVRQKAINLITKKN